MAADLVALAQERSYDKLESAWLEAVEAAGREDVAPFLAVADALASQNEPERAATLLGLLLPPLKGADRSADALRAARRAIELSTRGEDLRAELVGLLRTVHKDRRGFEAYLRLSGLDGKEPVRPALQKLDQFLDYPVGRHVFHAAGWGIGVVKDVDPKTGDLTIDFETKKGHVLPVDSALRFLQKLADDHIWALRHSAHDRLKAMVDQSPDELVKIVVRSRPEKKATLVQIKAELIKAVVPEKQWSKFWSKAKGALLHDELVSVSDDTRPVISIRQQAVRFADEVRKKIDRASSLDLATAAARQFLKQATGTPAKVGPGELDEVATTLAARIAKDATKLLKDRPGIAVEGWFVLEDFLGAGVKLDGIEEPGSPIAPVIAASRSLERFLETAGAINEGVYLKRYVDRVKKENAQTYAERFAATLPAAPKEVFALAAAALKEANPTLLGKTLARIASLPDPDAESFLELSKEAFQGKFAGVPGAPEAFQVLERLLAFADRIERLRSGGAPNAPNLRPRVRSLLEDDDYGIVRRYFRDGEKEPVRHLYARIMSSHAIDDEVREVARGIVVRRMPEILTGPQRKHFWDDEAHIWVTRKGLSRYEAEFQELANEKIPANARAIGAAAALGDLSENAEFTAALEERNQLVARADRMKKDLERAKSLEDAPLEEGIVGPGMRVELRKTEDDKAEHYIILGPWDVDLERAIISYTAPLAKGLLGRKVGESVDVQLPGGQRAQYEVTKIEPAL